MFRAIKKGKIFSWIKILRLQFYPMTWVAYSMGAVSASITGRNLDPWVYGLGYAALFFVELSTILTNEYYDFSTDRLNQNAGSFTGGSRVLVEEKLGFHEVRAGIFVALALAGVIGVLLSRIIQEVSPLTVFLLLSAGIFMGLGYTAPPFKLCYRGLGEVTVGITHSPYMILCGFIFQGGAWNNSLPWLLSIPLFFATLAAITMAGVPDRSADRLVSKRVLAVILGPRAATVLAAFFVCLAALSGILLWNFKILKGVAGVMIFLVIPHGFFLLRALWKLIRSRQYDRKIDEIMALSLSYIVWFGLIPLISLLWG